MAIASASAANNSPSSSIVWPKSTLLRSVFECLAAIPYQNIADPMMNIANVTMRSGRFTANRVSHRVAEHPRHPRLRDAPGCRREAMPAWQKMEFHIGRPLAQPVRELQGDLRWIELVFLPGNV